MKKIQFLTLAGLLALCLGAAETEPVFRLLAPSAESFLSGSKVLIIGKVEGFHDAKMVEILDNGKTVGFAPLKNDVFIYQGDLGEGRHEISLAAPGIKRHSLKVFMGKQSGYRYHIDPEPSACAGCHPKASSDQYALPPLQEGLCGECHEKVSGGQFVHGPVAAGSCTPCHDPHGSRYEKFLVASGKDLCLTCHSQTLSMKHIEERANADCVKCHDPHRSEKNFHLR